MKKDSTPILGIDFGTTTSLVAYPGEGAITILPNERGTLYTPSVVAYRENKTAWVGELAQNQLLLSKENSVIAYPKLCLGSKKRFSIQGRQYTPSEVSLVIFRKLKKIAAESLGLPEKDLTRAVLAVPAHFNDNQRQATLHAGALAGLEVVKLITEPVAVALSYGFHNEKEDRRLMILDLGGGTLDITLIKCKQGHMFIKAIGGSGTVGGLAFDHYLAKYLANRFEALSGISFHDDPVLFRHLLQVAERAKRDLSYVDETRILCPYVVSETGKKLFFNIKMKRSEFKNLVQPLFKKIEKTIGETFIRSAIMPGWVDTLVLAGGASRMPGIERLVRSLLNKRVNVRKEITPENAVVLGTAVMALLVEKQDTSDLELYDVTSSDLGVEDDNGGFVCIIPRGTRYPCKMARLFTTTRDYETSITIHVLQSQETGNKRNICSLGYCNLTELPRAKAGTLNIEVTFSINANGILRVNAHNLDTGKETKMTMHNVPWLDGSSQGSMLHGRRGTALKII